ncbi:chemotaxis protein CheW [Wenzhouxiangella marina]|uniref:Chemotaxis protein CheW n=1 Tax=Wenzhouxiangella marina TaxID=1579979 RepID=A0A0K0XSV8_9GAMM|nr:chemotaxis protein CheW [Wenzhouxiangella marina]AKS40745.1 chemotaxis protein CheW [Wenzhouxiangella marina]MBB6087618.1 chemosensory pili system protein ChpC [Wenzhouxiangella marina]
MAETEIRSVMVPISGAHILVPNATVAEVVGYSDPQPVPDAPEWLLGTFLWRGWQVPLISFAALTETAETERTNGARFCITKTLIQNERMPYVAILAQGFPRLTTITEDNLTEVPMDSKPIAVAGKVIVESTEALVPDLDRLGHLVAHAAFGALPLTS